MIKKIILAFKTHFDIGFTDTAENVIKSYKGKMLEDVLETCGSTKDMGNSRYMWTMPSWPLYEMIDGGKNVKSEKAEQVCEFVKNGQLLWHCLPFTSHFDFCGFEDYLRGFTYAEKLHKEFNIPNPISAKMTDVPGHGAMLPTFLNMMGVKFMHIGVNDFATPLDVPLLFNWEGIDGSKVLMMYSKASYGTSLEAPIDWEFPVWLALLHTHDNCGPQSADTVNSLIEKAKKLYPEAEVVTGSMDDFYYELMKYNPKVPTIKGDLGDTWIHGVGTYPKEVSQVREVRGMLTRIEKLASLLKQVNNVIPIDEINELIEKAYLNLLLFGEHTWGLDMKTHMDNERPYEKEAFNAYKNSDNYNLLSFSWDEQRRRATKAMEYCKKAEKIILEHAKASITGSKLIIFNPSSRKENEYIDITHLKDAVSDSCFTINGKIIEPEIVGGKLFIFIEDLPAINFIELKIISKESVQEKQNEITSKNFIENNRYKIVVNKELGRIVELFDKKLQKNIIDTTSDDYFLGYRYDIYALDDINEFLRSYGYIFSDWGISDNGKKEYPRCKHITYRPQNPTVTIKNNCIQIQQENYESVKLYGDAEKIITKISLPNHTDDIYVNVSVINKQETLYGESGYITIPFNFKDEKIMINKLGCMLDISKDIVKDANHVNYCIENSVVISDDENAVTIYAKDTPLVSIDEVGMFKFRSEYEKHKPNIYFNTYNNMWGTNFPQWISGSFEFSFVITSHNANEIPEQYYRVLNKAEGTVSFCSDEFSYKEINFERINKSLNLPENLRISSIITNNENIIVHIREVSGKNTEISIDVSEFLGKAKLINIRGEEIVKSKNNTLNFISAPYGIYSILL